MDNSINFISFQSLVCSISKSQPYVWNFNSNGGSFSLSRLHCLVHQVCPSKMAHRSNLAKFGNFYSISRRNKIAPLPILASLCLMIYKMVPLPVKALLCFIQFTKWPLSQSYRVGHTPLVWPSLDCQKCYSSLSHC